MFYLMKSKYAIYFHIKVKKIKCSAFFWDTRYSDIQNQTKPKQTKPNPDATLISQNLLL